MIIPERWWDTAGVSIGKGNEKSMYADEVFAGMLPTVELAA
jgi:hypothetical protein